ncbi:MAG: hypothetical protein JWP92_3717 [Caulobacter sp.]|nr:hypothetical protein [Caulobacter sp.]
MRGGTDHFKITSVWDRTSCRYERVQTATCGKCGHAHAIHDAGGTNPKPVSVMAEKFRQKGWRIGPKPNSDRCPRCERGSVARSSAPLTPAQKRAAYCRIADVPRAASKPEPPPEKPQEAPMTKPALVLADPPRQPSREDRRRIIDGLDDSYLPDKGCYAKDGSDKALAERLKVPRAWVAEERERAFGPDVCEADSADLAQLTALSAKASDLETRAMDVAAEAEAMRRQITALRGRIDARCAS